MVVDLTQIRSLVSNILIIEARSRNGAVHFYSWQFGRTHPAREEKGRAAEPPAEF
jgi:hypothetical protein